MRRRAIFYCAVIHGKSSIKGKYTAAITFCVIRRRPAILNRAAVHIEFTLGVNCAADRDKFARAFVNYAAAVFICFAIVNSAAGHSKAFFVINSTAGFVCAAILIVPPLIVNTSGLLIHIAPPLFDAL